MRVACCVIKFSQLAESSVFNAAVLSGIVEVDVRRKTLIMEYFFCQSNDRLAGHYVGVEAFTSEDYRQHFTFNVRVSCLGMITQ